MIKASCLCEAITFQVEEIPSLVFNCHCSRCRRAHGASFTTLQVCHKSSLIFLAGKDKLSQYQVGGIVRTFCSQCGSRLLNYDIEKNYLSVSLGVVRDRPDLKPVGECFTKDRLPFSQLNSNIPHFEGPPL